jgi:hypothetical protein
MSVRLYDSLEQAIRKNAYIIRATEVGQFLNCPRNWMFMSHNGLNLEQRVRPQKLRFGIVWHAGLEALYRNKDPYKALDEEFEKEVQLLRSSLAYDADMHEKVEGERTLAKALMEGYLQWRNTEATPPDRNFSPLHVERRLVVPLLNTRAYLAARLDAELLDNSGGLWILEHKSRGKSSSVDNPPELQLDLQMGLQMFACGATSTYPLRGVLYNLTRKQMPSNRVRSPIYGRHAVMKSKNELAVMQFTLLTAYRAMSKATNLIKKDTERAMFELRYNPQPMGFCQWGCSVKEICESINRKEDVQYLIDATLKPREKTIWEVLEEELAEN